VVVLATCVGEEGEFRDAGADVLECGCTGCEACVSHGWVCKKGKKIDNYRRATNQHYCHCQYCYLIL